MSTKLSEAFNALLDQRRSVRGYLAEPALQELLNRVFEQAQRAPSNCNTQPWKVYVVSGQACENLRKKFPESVMQGKMTMDFDYQGKYHGVYKDRQYDAAAQLYDAMGIAREDKEKRGEAFFKNFEFFGAPHVAFLFLPEQFAIREAADLGMYAQNLMLSLSAHGLASCPQTALSFDADMVREELGVDSTNKLLFGISFGYEDIENPANKCRVSRDGWQEHVHFID